MEPGSLKPVQNIQLPPELGKRGKGKDRERDWGCGDPFILANCPPWGGWRIPCVGPWALPLGHSFPAPPFPPDPINLFIPSVWAKMAQIGQNPFWRAQGSILARTWRDNALWPGYSHPCQSLASSWRSFAKQAAFSGKKKQDRCSYKCCFVSLEATFGLHWFSSYLILRQLPTFLHSSIPWLLQCPFPTEAQNWRRGTLTPALQA